MLKLPDNILKNPAIIHPSFNFAWIPIGKDDKFPLFFSLVPSFFPRHLISLVSYDLWPLLESAQM